MPRTSKFDSDEIVEVTLKIAKTEGLEGVTARIVAKELNSSVAPIYVHFDNIESLKEEVIKKFFSLSATMISNQDGSSYYEKVGKASIAMAKEYPILYRELVIQPNPYMPSYDDTEKGIIAEMAKDEYFSGWSIAKIKKLFLKMKVFQTGLTVMIASQNIPSWASESDLNDLLIEVGRDLLSIEEKNND